MVIGGAAAAAGAVFFPLAPPVGFLPALPRFAFAGDTE